MKGPHKFCSRPKIKHNANNCLDCLVFSHLGLTDVDVHAVNIKRYMPVLSAQAGQNLHKDGGEWGGCPWSHVPDESSRTNWGRENQGGNYNFLDAVPNEPLGQQVDQPHDCRCEEAKEPNNTIGRHNQ